MNDANKVTEKIEKLRARLAALIQVKGDLKDPEVVEASRLLDKALNKYNYQIFSGFRQ